MPYMRREAIIMVMSAVFAIASSAITANASGGKYSPAASTTRRSGAEPSANALGSTSATATNVTATYTAPVMTMPVNSAIGNVRCGCSHSSARFTESSNPISA